MKVKERIIALRRLMEKEGIDAFLVPTDDFHGSEYVGEYFKSREYITGFTGSAGKALIFAGEYATEEPSAGLWTDARYFLQAEAQLEDSGVALFKMEEPGVPKLVDFLADRLDLGAVIGFDGRTISAQFFAELEDAFEGRKKDFKPKSIDLIDKIWGERPRLSCEKAELFAEKYAGKSRQAKLEELKKKLDQKNANMLLISTLDDIAWLLNIRGADVACNPVVLSYFVIDGTRTILFVQERAIAEIRSVLEGEGIEICPYEDMYRYVRENSENKTIVADKEQINYELLSAISKKSKLIDERNYNLIPKAIKNETEVENMRLAHLKDGVAKTKWMYWLKNNVGKIPMDEISVAEKLHEFRAAQENSRGDSFEPIMGYEEHGAIIHYSATSESASSLEARGLLLADTGGQYLEGTTDITRTIALGEITDEQKRVYTAVLRGHLMLQGAKFPQGTKGSMLDDLARKPTEEKGDGYKHGTGHGVGMYLNVHEDPVRITRASVLGKRDIVFEEGMITSNEPGLYLEGKFGVRIENLEVCTKAEMCQGVQMMKFEPLTLVPYEREALEIEQMSEEEKALYNEYQSLVYEKLSPYLEEDERAWLLGATKAI